jgi:hypothetical protein
VGGSLCYGTGTFGSGVSHCSNNSCMEVNMKKFIFVIFVSLTMVSCDQLSNFMEVESAYDSMRDPKMQFSSFEECGKWIANNIRYDNSGEYEWQSPYQTIERRSGMCVDFVSTLLWYAIEHFGANPNNSYLLGVRMRNGNLHALCVVNGIIYEAQTFKVVTTDYYEEFIDTLSLEEVLNEIYYEYGNRNVQVVYEYH